MEFLQHLHSGLRWVVLILMLAAIGQAFASMNSKPFNRKLALFSLISVHTQVLIGLVLYFWGKWYQSLPEGMPVDDTMKSVHRFFGMEHIAGMLIAAILITIGNSRAKKAATDKAKWKSIAVFFTIGLVIILACIPWPFMQKFSNMGWF
jgi:chromate transport protein ChrA